MAAASASFSEPDTLIATRAERIARGILLVQQGHTLQDAGTRAGVAYVAIWRALKKLDDEWAERDENAWRRATSKAEVVAEMVLDRMSHGIATCPPSVLPSWGMFAARVAGWDTVKERAEGGESMLGAILERLSKGGGNVQLAVSAAVAVNRPPTLQSAQDSTQTGDCGDGSVPGTVLLAPIAPTPGREGEK